MTEPLPHHVVAVWNPSYSRNAMDEHLAVLLRHAAGMRERGLREEDVYVWWGRVHSRNRRTQLPHLDDIRAIDATLDDDDAPETHLYLTDYQSLYVADLAEIHFGELPATEATHVPSYYATDHLGCDFWFKLWDIRRLVTDDMLGTIEELKRLRSVAYHDQPVSLYGGMVNLPLVVTRPDGALFFDDNDRDVATKAALWAEFDAEMGTGIMSVERTLRDDLLGEMTWGALDPTVRNFIATAEKVFRDHRADPAFDFAPVLGSFSKALEVQIATVLRHVLPKLPKHQRYMNDEGNSVDLAERRSLMLKQVVQALAGDQGRTAYLSGALLDQFRQVRNEGTHESRIDRKTATYWRNQLLGVGCAGHFVELAKVKLR
jgi:hypothetical protein